MRFKAKLAPEQVALLYQLVGPISKLSGSGVEGSRNRQSSGSCWMTRNGSMLRLDDTHLQLSTAGRTQDTDGITCFAELATAGFGSIFLEKVIESAAPHNAIVMELDLGQLRLALRSVLGGGASGDHHHGPGDWMGSAAAAGAAGPTVLKLAKRNRVPCLCIDAATLPAGATLIQVHHAIPVRIRRHQEMQHHLPPPHAAPDVQLELMPSSSTSASTTTANSITAPLRTIVEKLKPLSPVLYLEATTAGELTVSAHQDGASVQAFFSKLKARHTSNSGNSNNNQQNGDGSERNNNSPKTATVKMDTKKLWVALQGLQQSSSSLPQQQTTTTTASMASQAVLCLVENEMVVVHVSLPHGVGFFTYYVPVHFWQGGGSSQDDDDV